LRCANYRIAFGLLGDEAHVKAFIVTGTIGACVALTTS